MILLRNVLLLSDFFVNFAIDISGYITLLME